VGNLIEHEVIKMSLIVFKSKITAKIVDHVGIDWKPYLPWAYPVFRELDYRDRLKDNALCKTPCVVVTGRMAGEEVLMAIESLGWGSLIT
jgi:hypothetical protein